MAKTGESWLALETLGGGGGSGGGAEIIISIRGGGDGMAMLCRILRPAS